MSDTNFKIGDTVICILDQPSTHLDKFYNVRIDKGFIGRIRGFYGISNLGVYFEDIYNNINTFTGDEVAYSINRFTKYELPESVKLETYVLIEQKERLEFF